MIGKARHSWSEPREYRKAAEAGVAQARPWWLSFAAFLFFAGLIYLICAVLRIFLEPSNTTLPQNILAYSLLGGFIASYLIPLLVTYLPSKVSIGEKMIRHSRGLTGRSRLLSSFEGFEFKPAGKMGEYQLLVLYPKQGLPWIFALDEEMSALQLSLFFEIKGLEKRGELIEPNVEEVEGSEVLDAEEIEKMTEGESL